MWDNIKTNKQANKKTKHVCVTVLLWKPVLSVFCVLPFPPAFSLNCSFRQINSSPTGFIHPVSPPLCRWIITSQTATTQCRDFVFSWNSKFFVFLCFLHVHHSALLPACLHFWVPPCQLQSILLACLPANQVFYSTIPSWDNSWYNISFAHYILSPFFAFGSLKYTPPPQQNDLTINMDPAVTGWWTSIAVTLRWLLASSLPQSVPIPDVPFLGFFCCCFVFFFVLSSCLSSPSLFPHLLLSSCGRGSSVGSSREAHLQIILLIFPCYITPVLSPLRCRIVPPVTVTISSACSNCVNLVYNRNWYSTFQCSCRVFPPATPASYYLGSTCAAPGWLCLHACTLTTASNLCIWVQAENPDLTLKALEIFTCSHHQSFHIMKMNWRLFRLLWSLWLYTHIINEV